MSLLRWWRQRGWVEIDKTDYQFAHAHYGGSVITHPQFIEILSAYVGVTLGYFGRYDGGRVVAAIPVWDSSLAGNKGVLKREGQYDRVDLGNMEAILPIAPQADKMPMHFKANYVSDLNAIHINTLRQQRETLSLLKSYRDAEFSKKFLYNRTREWRLLQEAGVTARSVTEFTPRELAGWYIDLFERRWQKKPKAYDCIEQQLYLLREFLTGKVLLQGDTPIAIQLIFYAESPGWTSFEFVNGGVNPEFHKYSPGSVLTFLNTQAADIHAQNQGKKLRYSFGRTDEDYKSLWCNQVPVYRV